MGSQTAADIILGLSVLYDFLCCCGLLPCVALRHVASASAAELSAQTMLCSFGELHDRESKPSAPARAAQSGLTCPAGPSSGAPFPAPPEQQRAEASLLRSGRPPDSEKAAVDVALPERRGLQQARVAAAVGGEGDDGLQPCRRLHVRALQEHLRTPTPHGVRSWDGGAYELEYNCPANCPSHAL